MFLKATRVRKKNLYDQFSCTICPKYFRIFADAFFQKNSLNVTFSAPILKGQSLGWNKKFRHSGEKEGEYFFVNQSKTDGLPECRVNQPRQAGPCKIFFISFRLLKS